MAKKPDIAQKLITSAFELAATRDWSGLSMEDIANQAEVPLPKALSIFHNKEALLYDVMNRADNKALGECLNFQEEDTVKDKLFALIMARFEYLTPYRSGIAGIVKSSRQNPLRALCRFKHFMQSMKLMLETSGVQTRGPAGAMKINGLALVSSNAGRVWLNDESEDLSPTMAALDKGLIKADKLAHTIFCAMHNNS